MATPRLRRRRLLAVLVGLVLAAVAGEVGFSIYHLFRYGELSRSGAIAERQRVGAEEGRPQTGNRWENSLVVHPLFGYTLNPAGEGVNNFGFRTSHDFELSEDGYRLAGVDRDTSLVVGIFGGSFAHYAGMNSAHLEKVLDGAFPGRPPVVVDMAMGGHALPQAGFIFLYFKEAFDVVVFLDGLNEVWNAPVNNSAGYPPEFAKAAHYRHKLSRQELSPETFERSARILAAKENLTSLSELSQAPVLRQSLLVHYGLWKPLSRLWRHRIASESVALAELYAKEDAFFAVPDERIIEHAVARWRTHHDWMHLVAEQDRILDLHLLQPSPWLEGSKRLTDEEREKIETLPVGEFVVAGYPGLRREIAELAASGVVAEDLTMIFADREESLWMDGAHVVNAGSRIVLDRIAALIRAHWHPAAASGDEATQRRDGR